MHQALITPTVRGQAVKRCSVHMLKSLFVDHAPMVVFLSNFETVTDRNPT